MYYKIIERAILTSIFYFIVSSSIAQCPVLDGAMVNSCGANEGANEFAIFTMCITVKATRQIPAGIRCCQEQPLQQKQVRVL